MSALCCCVPRRKLKQEHRPQPRHNDAEYHQERPQQIPGTVPRKLSTNAGADADKRGQTKEIPFGTPAHLDELVVDDDDSDIGSEEPQPQPHLTRRASAALGAVRARFIRHLSSETDVKRQSTASVGKSQEEIARRAELRRLRHKRIQDELKNELRGERTTDQTSNASIKSARPGSLTSPSQSQPGGGPRDTIEFAVLDGNQVSPRSRSPAPSLASKASIVDKPQLSPQTSSLDSQPDQDDGSAYQNRENSSKLADHGAFKPIIQPLPHSETRSTFRLSSSPSWLDRIIGVDNTFSETGDHPSLDGRSVLSIWLAAQGLRSRDSSMARLDHDMKTEAEHEPGPKDVKQPDETSISVSEVPRQSGRSSSGSQGSRELAPIQNTPVAPAHLRPHKHVAEPTSTTDQGSQQITKSPSEDLALDYAAALAFTSPNDNTSSQYASGAQSFQPSPCRSRPNLHHLDTLELQDMPLSPFQWQGNLSVQRKLGRSEAQSSYATAQDHISTSDLLTQPSPKVHTADSDGADGVSFAQSETASFQIREAELQTIEKRFAYVLSRRKPVPFISRFKEEFNDDLEPSKKRPSFIPRLVHLHVPGKTGHKPRSNASGSIAQQYPRSGEPSAMRHHLPNSFDQKQSSSGPRGSLTPLWNEALPRAGLKESATDLWQRAIRQEAEQRTGRSSKSGLSTQPTPSHSKNSLKPKHGEDTRAQVYLHPHRPEEYLTVPQMARSSIQSKWNLPRWSTSSTKLKDVHGGWPRLPMDLAVAPESWAKYPAHDREQRNARARSDDNVESQDFAIRPVSSEGHIGWATDEDVARDDNTANRRSVSMHGKLGKAVKSGITKLFPFTENLGEARSNSLGRRRGSFQLAGEVEYPELEVLPPGIGHILEPEQVADVMSSRRRSRTGSSRRSFGRHSVSKTIEHRQLQNQDLVVHEIPRAAKSVEVLPKTPLKVLGHKDKQSTPRTEVFVTPLSTSLVSDASHDRSSRQSRLPVAKSEQALPFYKVHPGGGAEAGWTRSFTWSGSLSSTQTPPNSHRRGGHELHVLRRPGDANASKDSFATGASFATAAAE